MKRLKLKYWVKAVLMMIPLLILFAMVINKIDEGFIETCTKEGYTITYCERSK